MSREALLTSLNGQVNPVTKRKFSSGPAGTALTALKTALRENTDSSRFWNTKECPTGAFIQGRCFTSKQSIKTIISFLKAFKAAEKTNTRPEREQLQTNMEKKKKKAKDIVITGLKSQRNKAGKRIEEVKQNLSGTKKLLRDTEVIAYLRKKELNEAQKKIKKLELNAQKMRNQMQFTYNQRNTLL